jgi:hypothetical protein
VKEDADAERRLDTAVLSVAGFGDAQVQRIAHSRGVHASRQQAVDFENDRGVRRLHRQDEIAVVPVLADANELQRRFDHPQGRIPEAVHDAIRERTVIGADAHRDTSAFARRTSGENTSWMRTSSASYSASEYSRTANRFLSAKFPD